MTPRTTLPVHPDQLVHRVRRRGCGAVRGSAPRCPSSAVAGCFRCWQYQVHRDAADPTTLVFYELWRSGDDLRSHLARLHTAGRVGRRLGCEPSPAPVDPPGRSVSDVPVVLRRVCVPPR
ncbi:putative quinol monooxygenase [Streptomyces sp. NPDC127119]|uniref:putative quinol monooxygenase n=1 Tax=Streptomyces sp. NPDC127119 TaxID=3345370 RepID=UPI0036371966